MITVAGILASHGPKRLLNDVEIMGTRLGQRPNSTTSKHNMPSGHSTLAGACAYFLMRRYSIWFGVIVIPVLLLTMYARVMLDKHTFLLQYRVLELDFWWRHCFRQNCLVFAVK